MQLANPNSECYNEDAVKTAGQHSHALHAADTFGDDMFQTTVRQDLLIWNAIHAIWQLQETYWQVQAGVNIENCHMLMQVSSVNLPDAQW